MATDNPYTAPRSVQWLLVLLGLWGFAVAQPVLGILGANPVLTSSTNVSRPYVFTFAAIVALAPPVALWSVDLALGSRLRWGQRFVVAAALLALFVGRLLNTAKITNAALVIGVSLVVAAGAAWFGLQRSAAQRFLSFTAILPFLAVGTFFLGSETADFLQAEPAVAALAPSEVERPPVVVLVLDELPTMSIIAPDGTIDADRFPNLAAFGGDATWYRHFSTVSPFTSSAIPAMFTGTNPTNENGLWTNFPNNIFSLLAADYHLAVAEGSTKLCGFAACENDPLRPPSATPSTDATEAPVKRDSGEDADRFRSTLARLWWEGIIEPSGTPALDDFAEQPVQPSATTTASVPDAPPDTARALTDDEFRVARGFQSGIEGQPQRFVQLLDTMHEGDETALYFGHVLLPHQPFMFDQRGRMFVRTGEPYEPTENVTPWVATTVRQLHLSQAQYADALVGELLERLHDTELYDDAVVAIVADHGISFETGTHPREYSPEGLPGIAYAPFLVKAAGQTTGTIDDSNMLSVDVLPTIAEAIGIEMPWTLDGATPSSDAVAARGSEKYLYDYSDAFDPELIGIVTFDDDEAFGRVLAGAVGGRHDHDIGGADLVGGTFEPQSNAARVASVAGLEQLRSGERLGSITGTLEAGVDVDSTVVVALNDVVVGVSPLGPYHSLQNYFAVAIDPELVDPVGATLRIALRSSDGTLQEMEVSPA